MMMQESPDVGTDSPAIDHQAGRCGHNFPYPECPYSACGFREAMAEIEKLRKDRARLEWILPICSLTNDAESLTDARALRIAGALLMGKSGREAIDAAMEAEAAR